ncbi:MAG: periplasmic heavy metal sensor [Candidatus Devosia phytovorans]|uniref:Periplasmic heavy metal sensor n=1 Tax=Candidatus Devosia phytovorans TaxID=3121372 RepID=A0AAJ6B094_9HYPH|nr:periplasmic heavy metal sensor [Devosia sp.]WEK03293.1 MAG: periplasmic heavy metal sensor [Devosia sp.]
MSPLRLGLIVSLGLNIFVLGWWVGGLWRDPRPMEPRPFVMADVAASRLSPETLEAIKPTLDAVDHLLQQGFSERVSIFQELTQAVRAEPYDEARVTDLLLRLVDARKQAETEQWRLVGDALADLSAAERSAFAEIVFLGPRGPGGPPPPGGPMMPPPR